MPPKTKKTYYSVTALQDGTIYFAFQTRKPVKSNMTPRPQVDEDGIHTWHFEKQADVRRCTDWAKGVHHSAVVNALNTKRILRERIEGRLDRIESQLTAIGERLSRMEQAMK